MQIVVNGEERVIGPMTIREFLTSLGIDPQRVAVELNLDILPKDAYGTTELKEGDRLEIVHFVGGGCEAKAPPVVPHKNQLQWR